MIGVLLMHKFSANPKIMGRCYHNLRHYPIYVEVNYSAIAWSQDEQALKWYTGNYSPSYSLFTYADQNQMHLIHIEASSACSNANNAHAWGIVSMGFAEFSPHHKNTRSLSATLNVFCNSETLSLHYPENKLHLRTVDGKNTFSTPKYRWQFTRLFWFSNSFK